MVTIGLSMPLTILDALQRFSLTPTSIGSKLVIHILGAQMDFEMTYGAMAFEEIMHQLPWVTELLVEFIGPLAGSGHAGEIPMDTCPRCKEMGRRRVYRMSKSVFFLFSFCRVFSRVLPQFQHVLSRFCVTEIAYDPDDRGGV